ncbi:MAG TPA: hypothetical protein VGI39_16925, partial [Polyangiaceae bacterium]
MRLTLNAVLYPLLAGSGLVVALGAGNRAAASGPPAKPVGSLAGIDDGEDRDDPNQHPGDGPASGGAGATATGGTTALGTWRAMTHPFPAAQAGVSLVLTDGTIVVQNNLAGDWWRLTPDASGSYANGTWSPLPLMPDAYAPDAFASAVL